MQRFPIFKGDRFGFGENPVKLSDGIKGVHIRRVAMVILVLHQAVEPFKFRDHFSEHSQFMHQLEAGVNRTDFTENGLEADKRILRLDHFICQQVNAFVNFCGEKKVRNAIKLLAMAEYANQAHRIHFKYIGFVGGKFAAPQNEAVQSLGALKTLGPQNLPK